MAAREKEDARGGGAIKEQDPRTGDSPASKNVGETGAFGALEWSEEQRQMGLISNHQEEAR
jgi:hypothetical protein